MTDDQAREISRGEHAARILSDPLVQEALAQIRDKVRDAFFGLPIDAPGVDEQRARLVMLDKMRQQFEGVFAALMGGAEVARQELLMEENVKAKAAAVLERVRHG